MIPRCLLFVPALDRARYDKALASGPDAICIDLEDAVAPARKDEARAVLTAYLAQEAPADAPIWVRINETGSDAGGRDVAALAALGRPLRLMVPKAERAEAIVALSAAFATPPLIMPLIETARGLHQVEMVAAAHARVTALLFGPGDLSQSLGAQPEWDAMLYGRSRTVLAARLAGIAALDGPHFDLADAAGAGEAARRALALGFDGKAAVHPRQVAPILAAFTPPAAEIAFARKVMAAFADPERGVAAIDGRLVDGPLIAQARRTLRRAGEPAA